MVLSLVSGIFALIVGVGILGLWLMLILTKQVPEMKTEPIAIAFHIVVENVMGMLSVLSGIVLLLDLVWAPYLFILSMGLVIYAVINSSGYYAQRDQWAFVGMFGVIPIISTILVILNIVKVI